MLTSDSSLISLNGIGDTRAKRLMKLGVFTLRDLVYYFPRSYERRGNVKLLTDYTDTGSASYLLTVASEVKSAKIRQNLTISKFRAFDDSSSCEIVFFNSPYVKDVFHVGDVFRFFGKLNINKNKLQLSNPKYEKSTPESVLPDLVPIYSLTEGISGKILNKIIGLALNSIITEIKDPLPDDTRIQNSLPTLSYALKNIHFPESEEALQKAIKRLSFDELFYFGIGISLSARYKSAIPGVRFSNCDMKEFTKILPYELTNSQKNSINDIYLDTVIKTKQQENGHMARIIVGDVGSGKTVCAAAAIFIALKSGFQCALMAPTEILARQHYAELSLMFEKFGYKTELLIGATGAKEKRRIYESAENGIADLIIGTHALLSDKLNFKNLGLVITDEQHRFGVAQRAVLNEKSSSAHMLVMSATPIPRTLALAMYGDLDVSRITEMPKGRQRVDTYVVDEGYRERLNSFIMKQIALGGQCYIVCPAIEQSNDDEENQPAKDEIKNVLDYADNLRQKFNDINIDVLHGKVKAKEKDEIMARFSKGETKILVSTTVIEVGINVPNASLMIIENADRYGLSQLHQLRGRVGRGTRKSYCVLVSDMKTEKAQERLNVMRTTYDGFEIANKDLELRGPGDFFSSNAENTLRQSGGFDFKLADFYSDVSLLEAAFAAAKAVVQNDPELKLKEHALLNEEIQKHIHPIAASIS